MTDRSQGLRSRRKSQIYRYIVSILFIIGLIIATICGRFSKDGYPGNITDATTETNISKSGTFALKTKEDQGVVQESERVPSAQPVSELPSPPQKPILEPEPKLPVTELEKDSQGVITVTDAAPLTNSIGMKLVWIPPGEFMMGSALNEAWNVDEKPQHKVKITKGFWMGQTEVTQWQYKAIMRTEPWSGKDYVKVKNYIKISDSNPAVAISWFNALEFCRKLSQRENRAYRLPTEAEWEYACRAGTTTRFSFGDSESSLSEYAWFASNTLRVGEGYPHPVAMKKPNAFGLYDMHGNIEELCSDWYWYTGYYSQSPIVDPQGPASGSERVVRGGAWNYLPPDCETTSRRWFPSEHLRGGFGDLSTGFRIVLQDFQHLDSVHGEISLRNQEKTPIVTETPAGRKTRIEPDATEREKQEKFELLIAEAKSKDNKKDGKEALNLLQEALQLYPADAEAQMLQEKILEYFRPNVGDVITNSIGMKLVWVPSGKFMMGSPSDEAGRQSDEGPQHGVTISKGFWMGQTEVTQGQYKAIMRGEPWSGFNIQISDNNPAEWIEWGNAVDFCFKLSVRENRTYRLPTEAEWEYACRAGMTTRFSFGDSESSLSEYTWFRDNPRVFGARYAHPVAMKKPNAFGLFDMHGNVSELCSDWYDDSYYSKSPVVDPQGPLIDERIGATDYVHVYRGGGYTSPPEKCRSARRIRVGPGIGQDQGDSGFRIVLKDFHK